MAKLTKKVIKDSIEDKLYTMFNTHADKGIIIKGETELRQNISDVFAKITANKPPLRKLDELQTPNETFSNYFASWAEDKTKASETKDISVKADCRVSMQKKAQACVNIANSMIKG